MNRIPGTAMVVAMLLLPVCASAQEPPAEQISLKQWDVSAGFGLPFSTGGSTFPFFDLAGVYGLNAGRYWTSHLKTEVAAAVTSPVTLFSGEDNVTVPGVPGFGSLTTWDKRQLMAVSAAGTYQFLENVFAHPYVSAGLRLGALSSHRSSILAVFPRPAFSGSQTGVRVPVPDQRRTTLLVSPFVAGGFKSYFNERTFVRSELQAAIGSRGVSDVTLGLGFGIDF